MKLLFTRTYSELVEVSDTVGKLVLKQAKLKNWEYLSDFLGENIGELQKDIVRVKKTA